MNASRRQFVIGGIGMGATLWLARANAAAPHLSVSDAAAKEVAYTEDAKQVDHAKYPTYANGHTCANCSLFQGAARDAWGGCSLFDGKQVAAAGWCTSWTDM
jgi:hypothetical protein